MSRSKDVVTFVGASPAGARPCRPRMDVPGIHCTLQLRLVRRCKSKPSCSCFRALARRIPKRRWQTTAPTARAGAPWCRGAPNIGRTRADGHVAQVITGFCRLAPARCHKWRAIGDIHTVGRISICRWDYCPHGRCPLLVCLARRGPDSGRGRGLALGPLHH